MNKKIKEKDNKIIALNKENKEYENKINQQKIKMMN